MLSCVPSTPVAPARDSLRSHHISFLSNSSSKDRQGGENPRFLRLGFVQMFYPAIVLLFFVIAVAELLKAWYST